MDCALIKNKEKLLFVTENDPSQRSAAAKDALHEICADLVEIPHWSPDLNPIENIFHNIKNSLREGALRQRLQYDTSVIDSTIETMNNRLQSIVKNGGYRTKY